MLTMVSGIPSWEDPKDIAVYVDFSPASVYVQMYGFSFFLVLFVYLTGNLNKNRLTQKAQDPTVCH